MICLFCNEHIQDDDTCGCPEFKKRHGEIKC